jgi:thymidylate synthase ThyX
MKIQSEPNVFLVAKTQLTGGMEDYLKHIGEPDWKKEYFDWMIERAKCFNRKTDLPSDADMLFEAAGRLCYRSWEPYNPEKPDATNPNVTKIRKGNKNYLKHVIDSGHGSVLEHATATLIIECSRVCTHEIVRNRAGMAFCLSGDTEVWSGARENGHWNGVKKKRTMKQLWEWSQDADRRLASRVRLCTVRCYDGEQFVPARIKSVSFSGRKIVYQMTLEDGRSIKASADHRFMGDEGWAPLRTFKVGDQIGCNGVLGAKWTQEAKDRFSVRQTGEGNPAWQGGKASPQAGRYRAHRLFKRDVCSQCGSKEQVGLHHKDRNTLNNTAENVEVLCNSCHGKLQAAEDGSPNVLRLDWKKITSIRLVGEEDTYDLEIDHPAHNFVANGIVTHNSQESLRYVRLDQLRFWVPKVVRESTEAMDFFENVVVDLEKVQKDLAKLFKIDELKDFAIKKALTSTFRRLAPMGLGTTIMVTGNLRAWRHVIEQRSSLAAEEEMRLVIDKIATTLKEEFTSSFQDFERNEQGEWVSSRAKV